RRLAGAVGPQHPDLGARIEGQVDVTQHLAIRWIEPAEVSHRVNELRSHAPSWVMRGTGTGALRKDPRLVPHTRTPTSSSREREVDPMRPGATTRTPVRKTGRTVEADKLPAVVEQNKAAEALAPNAWLVDEMYEQFLENTGSGSESWRDFFAE